MSKKYPKENSFTFVYNKIIQYNLIVYRFNIILKNIMSKIAYETKLKLFNDSLKIYTIKSKPKYGFTQDFGEI